MKVVGLLSGGKDSCYNLCHCVAQGHEVVVLASLGPEGGKGAGQPPLPVYLGQPVTRYIAIHSMLSSLPFLVSPLPISDSPPQKRSTRTCIRPSDRMAYT